MSERVLLFLPFYRLNRFALLETFDTFESFRTFATFETSQGQAVVSALGAHRDAWHHLAITYGADSITMFLDGKVASSVPKAAPLKPVLLTPPLELGFPLTKWTSPHPTTDTWMRSKYGTELSLAKESLTCTIAEETLEREAC